MSVLWILFILVFLATGLARRIAMDVSLVKYAQGEMRVRSFVWAGFVYAIDLIRQSDQKADGRHGDTLRNCGVSIPPEASLKEIFDEQKLEGGSFRVGKMSGDSLYSAEHFIFGLQDEERRINLNAMTARTSPILKELILLLGEDEKTAQTIVTSVLGWQEGVDPSSLDQGMKDSGTALWESPLRRKHRPFDRTEELLLIEGVTPQIFARIKDDVTVFPKNPSWFLLNFDTASKIVLQSLARSQTDIHSQQADADRLVEKIVSFRAGADGRDMTQDDRPLEKDDLDLNQTEFILWMKIQPFQTQRSRFLRIPIEAVDEATYLKGALEVIVDREDLSVVSWQRY